jgi:hypothetical protein
MTEHIAQMGPMTGETPTDQPVGADNAGVGATDPLKAPPE